MRAPRWVVALEFTELSPAAEGRPLQPLVAPEFTASGLVNPHRNRRTLGSVHALGVWRMQALTVAGYQSHLFIGEQRFCGPSIVPAHFEAHVAAGQVLPRDALALPERVIQEPTVVFMGWNADVYGEALVDMAPRVQIAARTLGEAPEDLAFLIASNAPNWFRDLAVRAGAARFIEYDQAAERVLLRHALVATHPAASALHPALADIFSRMRPRPAPGAGDAVFLTRRQAQTTRRIQMLNVDEIEAAAEQAGLRVVAPEQLSLADQAQLFADARLVAGEYGSALSNAVFCRRNAVIGAIGVRSARQSAISALCGLRQSYLDPLGDPEDPTGYHVDVDAFRRWLDALLDAADAPVAAAMT